MATQTKNLNLSVFDFATDSTQDFVNGIAGLQNSNMHKIDEAITDKVKIDNASSSVNFTQSDVVREGLVAQSTYSLNGGSQVVANAKAVDYMGSKFTIVLKDVLFYKSDSGTSPFIGWSGWHCGLTYNSSRGIAFQVCYWVDSTARAMQIHTIVAPNENGSCYVSNLAITYDSGLVTILLDGQKTILDWTKYTTWANGASTFRVGEDGHKIYGSGIVQLYNRILTPQEIQHNYSSLNNSPSINKINDYTISTNTNLITDRRGKTQEEINRVFYKSMCNEFVSSGSDIGVNNGMDGYLLQAKIEGQTVNNYCSTIISQNVANSMVSEGYITITKEADKAAISQIATSKTLTPDKEYDVIMFIKENNSNGNVFASYSDNDNCAFVSGFTVDLSKPIKTYRLRTRKDLSLVTRDLKFSLGGSTPGSVTFSVVIVDVGYGSYVSSPIPFGLSSTQATITNNSLKYSFYTNEEDKLIDKKIELNGIGEMTDSLEILDDGGAIFTSKYLKYCINGLENWSVRDTPSSGLFKYHCSNLGINSFTDFQNSGSKMMCSSYEVSGGADAGGFATEAIMGRADGNGFIVVSKISSLELFKESFKTNNSQVLALRKDPIVTHIPKELVPTILTQLQNTFSFGDAVPPSKVTIQVPINKVTDLETRLAQLEKVIASTSNISLFTNYVDDEYNNNQNKESEMF